MQPAAGVYTAGVTNGFGTTTTSAATLAVGHGANARVLDSRVLGRKLEENSVWLMTLRALNGAGRGVA